MGELKSERASWDSHYRELSEFLLPRNGRFTPTDRTKGGKEKFNKIYDNSGTRALGILAAGLMAGMTSPARPWFALATPDPGLMEFAPVKRWLHQVTRLTRDIMARSNFYRTLHSQYKEMGAFGTAPAIVLPDFQNVIHTTPQTVGEYYLATDYNGRVDTLAREYEMTVAQMVREFGVENVSPTVKNLWDSGKGADSWVRVAHIIQPRDMRDLTRDDKRHMPWESCYYEPGCQKDKYLREGGFKEFPVLAPRWELAGGDIYGTSPGMEALGDIKQLQHQQLRKMQAIDMMARPPIQAPSGAKNRAIDLLPGGVNYFDMAGNGAKASNLVDVRIDLSHLLADIQDVRGRIREAFYANLFMMIAEDDRSGITAREIAERHEEKLLMLGPVLERLHNELLSPAIDIIFFRIMDAGLLPPPPAELQGVDLKVEFVSVLAQAQRAVGTQAVDRLLGTVAGIAQLKPEVIDKLDGDQIIDAYSDMLGIDPNLIVADENVAMIRQSRQQQQQAMQAAQAAQVAADSAAKLGTVNTGERNMATDLMSALTGYT